MNYNLSFWYTSMPAFVDASMYDVRPYSLLNKNSVNFSANTSYTDGAWHDYQIDTDNFKKPIVPRLLSYTCMYVQACVCVCVCHVVCMCACRYGVCVCVCVCVCARVHMIMHIWL